MPKNKQVKKLTSDDSGYKQFLESLRLISINLKSCEASIDEEAYWKAHEKAKFAPRSLKEHYGVSHIGENYFDLHGDFQVKVSDGADIQPLVIRCSFLVHIHSDHPERALVDRFTDTDLRLLLLPYARHFVTNITGQMGVQPVVIPLAIGHEQSHDTEKAAR